MDKLLPNPKARLREQFNGVIRSRHLSTRTKPALCCGRIRALPPSAIGLERGCVQSTSRSTLKGSAASGIFQQAGFAKLLRLVFDTAALRVQCADASLACSQSN
jgi:hypothetical protein